MSSYRAIVAAFISEFRESADDEMVFFRGHRSLRDAIRVAALAKTREGKRYPHQRRIPGAVLCAAERRLQSIASRFPRCRSFKVLHDLVWDTIGPIHGIGPLTAYDIALRIGAYRGLEPEVVHLHAGTAEGARTLGFGRMATLDPDLLPTAFGVLKPREIEDCLCIFKGDLAQAAGTPLSRQ